MVVFAHLADCHIGAWRDPRMSVLVDDAFKQAIDEILAREVDFVIIAGDLFNTAVPPIDRLRKAVGQLERLKQAGIPVYFVAGSHDYSPTGKTMLGILEETGLATDVCRLSQQEDGSYVLDPVIDASTGVSLTGMLGRAGQLDTKIFAQLDTVGLLKDTHKNIFVFHAAIDELVASANKFSSQSADILPKGFDYYAGGHVHIVNDISLEGYDHIVYPGPLFPASFSELEELSAGGFYVVDLEADSLERVVVQTKEVVSVHLDVSGLTPDDAFERLSELLSARRLDDAVVLVRVNGTLSRGVASDIDFRSLFATCTNKGAYVCMKNTLGVSSPQLLVESEQSSSSRKEIEKQVLAEYAEAVDIEDSHALLSELLAVLSAQAAEDETKNSFEKRLLADSFDVFNLE